jgi:hypothetical protein
MAPALSAVVSLALGATAVSSSRLGVVVGGSNSTVDSVIAACPRAVKVSEPPFDPAGAGAVLRSYALGCTGGAGILELPALGFTPVNLTTAGGLADATAYWGLRSAAAFGTLPAGVDPAQVRWITGPPDLFTLVNPNASTGHADYAKAFVSQLATLVAGARTATVVYSLLLPPWTSTTPGAFCDVVNAARAADTGIGWTWGATSTLSTTLAGEASTTFGYRAVRDACASGASSISGVPIYGELSAAGGWISGGRTQADVLAFLTFVDTTAAADADVNLHGAILLRTLGGPADDLSQIAPQLVTYFKTPAVPSTGGGTSSGGVIPNSPHVGGGSGGGLEPTSGHQGGCGFAADGLALLSLAALAPVVLRRRRGR